MRRTAVVVCLLGMVALGCSDQLGQKVVECEESLDRVTTSLILAAQAVPGSDYLPCVEILEPGWDYNHVIAETGRAQFTLDSDRMGDLFLAVTVSTVPAQCDVGDALPVESGHPGMDLAVEVIEETTEIAITVIPVAPRHRLFAGKLATTMRDDVFDGQTISIEVEESADLMADRVAAAHAAGRHVFIVDDEEVKNSTVRVRRVGGEEIAGEDPGEALADIADSVGDPVYRARWFYTFDGACIRYDFDASGIGAQTVAEDATEVLGFLDVEPLRQLARDAGYGGFE